MQGKAVRCLVCRVIVAYREVGWLRLTQRFGKRVGEKALQAYLCDEHKDSGCLHPQVRLNERAVSEGWVAAAECLDCGKVGPERCTEETALAALRGQQIEDRGVDFAWH